MACISTNSTHKYIVHGMAGLGREKIFYHVSSSLQGQKNRID